MQHDNSRLFLLILLGMLTAFGPFVTDMYLPTLPSMAGFFATSSSMVQMGLTTSMIGLAVGQLFFGPLSDKYGRRRPLLAAMALFLVSTVLCITAHSIEQFVTMRFIQGVAASGGIVISRSVATDKFSGAELGRMLAVIGAINGVAPVTAPIIGGALTDRIGWQPDGEAAAAAAQALTDAKAYADTAAANAVTNAQATDEEVEQAMDEVWTPSEG